MTTELKRKKYLPVTYLQFFSADPKRCTHNSLLWRIDPDRQQRVQVGRQCSRHYHFSRADAAATEERFHDSERRYVTCIRKIRSGKALAPLESASLLAVMFDLHLRNAAHLQTSGPEAAQEFKARSRRCLKEVLLTGHSGPVRTADVARHLEEHWGLTVVRPTEGGHFITSDNPSVWISLAPARPTLHMVLLPLGPHHLAVAYDKRVVRMMNAQLTLADEWAVNAAQIGNGSQALYSYARVPDADLADLRARWARRPAASRLSDPGQRDERLRRLAVEEHYAFIQVAPQP